MNGVWLKKTFDNRLDNIGRETSFESYGPNWARVSTAPLRMFKAFTYEGGTRSPAMIAGPMVRGGRVSNAYASVKDIAPTLLALAAAPVPGAGQPAMSGRSMVNFLKGRSALVHPADKPQCLELVGRVAVRRGRWKLVFSNTPWGTGAWELFDLKADPGEQSDLAGRGLPIQQTLVADWQACQATNNIRWNAELADRISYGNINGHFER